MEDPEIINRVAQSNLTTLDLEEYFPHDPLAEIDLAPLLHNGLILREKDLRDWIKVHPWNSYAGKNVAVYCSADAIIPTWAFMLIGISLSPVARHVVFGNSEALLANLYQKVLEKMDWEQFKEARVVIKGCSKLPVPVSAYLQAAEKLRKVAASIFYGEPCSTVPLYKKPK